MRTILGAVVAATLALASLSAQTRQIRFVFTSDVHYGITRPEFRSRGDAPAYVVNAGLVAQMNTLTSLAGPMDFVAVGGDVANREEAADAIQPAAVSWGQFTHDYLERLTLRTASGAKTPVYVVPGNHDVSNAIGYKDKTLKPATDNSSLLAIYNLMMAPTRRTKTTYDYRKDHVLTSRDVAGVHFVFLTIWPDAIGRAWLGRELEHVSASTPVIVFTHDPPDGDRKHFDDMLVAEGDAGAEPAAWEAFIAKHPNITAYFHGHNNWNEFYDWKGPHGTVVLHTFRADSPMKGRASQRDETKLSFQVATIDTTTKRLTVRECLWNANPDNPSAPVVWGASTTVSLSAKTAGPSAGR